MGSPDPQTTLNFMREQCQELAIKINQMDLDKTEHELVMKALEPLDPDRKCFRMIGNVVVERTVGEVLPAVLKNRDQVRGPPPFPLRPRAAAAAAPALTHARPPRAQIKGTMDGFTEMLSSKQKEADEFASKHKIQSTGRAPAAKEAAADEAGSQGVLI